MSLLLDEPVRESADPSAPVAGARPRRARPAWRWRRWAGVGLALAIAYALLPLAVRLGQDVVPRLPVQAGLMVPEYGEAGTHFLAYEYGGTVTVGVPVRNRGPLPVTVRAVRLVEPGYPLLVPVGEAGDPVTLGPFEETTVALTYRYDNCRYYHERAAQSLAEAEVAGTVLGRDFTETVALDHPVAVHAQVITNCPERTLVRGDDRRLPAPGRG